MKKSSYSALVLMFLLPACVGSKDLHPEQFFTETDTYKNKTWTISGEEEPLPLYWWHSFENAELNSMVEKSLRENPSIETALAKVEQATAVRKSSRSSFLPDVSVGAGVNKSRSKGSSSRTEFDFTGAASYELDLFGKNRASFSAERKLEQAAMLDARTAGITLAASVVETWLSLNANKLEETLVLEQIQLNENMLKLQQMRHQEGIATALDVLNQHETLLRTKDLLPAISAEKATLETSLNVLMGQNPSSHIQDISSKPLSVLPLPDAGIPSDLLILRPDVMAAWWRLKSSEENVKVAERDRLPSFTLTGNFGANSTSLANVFDSWLLNLGANLAMPIIDGGKRRAEVERTEAVVKERLASYKEVVLNAIADVENAMTNIQKSAQNIENLKAQLITAKASFTRARLAYGGGEISYLNVMNSLNSLQALERNLIEAEKNFILSQISLYRSLGFGPLDTDIFKKKES